jgi:hypothetical protein
MQDCNHKCHNGGGLNPWVESCPVCHCPNPKFDPVNADRLKEEFLTEMEAVWPGFRESVTVVDFVTKGL